MYIDHNTVIVAQRESCAVCSSIQLDVAIQLPSLPLTDTYCREIKSETVGGIDQDLLICGRCGHAQLAKQVSPRLLYEDNYSFRSSSSAVARHGTALFLSMLREIACKDHFNCVVDLGCNDLYLLDQLRSNADRLVGIDPIWACREEEISDRRVTVVGAAVEDVDLSSVLDVPPDLIICRHTLEHIWHPRSVLKKLVDVAAPDAVFLFEVPGFESLVRRFRFDQVFHQHLQYFSENSFRRLLDEVGCVYVAHRENYHDWGALLIAFSKKNGLYTRYGEEPLPEIDSISIGERYVTFRKELAAANEVLKSFEGTCVYGYGAAQMLPVLAYHLNNNLSLLTAILDDDPNKDGMYYSNLPVVIRHSKCANDLEDASVFITAVDNFKPIMNKLLEKRPRHILYPFHIT